MKRFYKTILTFLLTVDTKKLFVESDAWWLFKYSALSEVVGWTLLIYGIVAPYYHLPGFAFMLAIGGSIHGMLFIGYIGVLAATYSSLGWTRLKALIGFLVSALPYGTLFFELWANRTRKQSQFGSYRLVSVNGLITKNKRTLMVQSSNSVDWQLPGGLVLKGESPEYALVRILEELTGITPQLASRVSQILHSDNGRSLGLVYEVANSKDFYHLDVQRIVKERGDIDEMRFINK